ncbi:M16 family metallopeptidase [Deinococcus cellulosilyticus]|uniref:Zinc protease n=1 Tax=Deinococcus cellulosilyticus (strain DSM 18568 / NBRC 106333 / KACC 11606 / 5516J-15) TaxID=1223518 RepID=A0A511MZU5_DEIC1|nr:pitrilysin family protein [Deinococcus cellulosilyticus]GEM45717.1 zinc protease [Deinococcus cellulosilyticus NBRC 106333 = KACC 11606]
MFLETTLPNGLKVIGEKNPEALSVAMGFLARAGSRDEPLELNGVSHFLEHMLFKGSETMSAQQINHQFDALGANYNAFTSEEVTVYHAAVLKEHSSALQHLLTELLKPAFRPEDFEVEKQVILEEIQMYQDDPITRLFDAAREHFWGAHPLGRSVLGTPETVGNLQVDAMREYFQTLYAPNNLIFAVTGAFDWDQVVSQLADETARWTPREVHRKYPEFKPTFETKTLREKQLNRTSMALMGCGLAATHEKRIPMNVLAELLGGENSRLHWALVHVGLADEATFSHVDGDGIGYLEAFISTHPRKAKEALQVFRKVIEEARENLSEAELSRARNKLALQSALRFETPYNRLFHLGLEHLYTGHYLSTEEAVQAIQKVTLEEVQDLLRSSLFDQFSLTVQGP